MEPVTATPAAAVRVPTAIESRCDPADLAIIREVYGSRGNTLINALLAFDSYFEWYYPYVESIPFLCPMAQREERAFNNMVSAIDMQEAFERLAINNHKSYLPHLAVYKVMSI